MPTPNETQFKVFYSWQSDLPSAVNLKLIRNALSQAAQVINAEHGLNLHVMIDEATRDVPGSPNIAETIFEKIRRVDAFVCDLTKVAEVQNSDAIRKYCNPNTAIELGYAIRVLGWRRIVIVFNEYYGVVPDDLPFDARGQRTSTYECRAELDDTGKPTAACQSQISNSTGSLRTTFVEALKLVIEHKPLRPVEQERRTPEEVRRERDVVQLKRAFHWINLRTIDLFIEYLSRGQIFHIGADLFESLAALSESSGFYLSDLELKNRLTALVSAWEECFKHSGAMDPHPNGIIAYFSMPGDIPRYPEQMDQLRFTREQAAPLRAALDSLLDYVRKNYLEIDPASSGVEAVRNFTAQRRHSDPRSQ